MSRASPSKSLSGQALFRYRVVSEVLVSELRGEVRAQAVRRAASHVHLGPDGRPRQVGLRSVYRWLSAFHKHGVVGLEDRSRGKNTTDGVLDSGLVQFLIDQKEEDPRASIPQLLDRAVHVGLLKTRTEVDRTTVWRAFKRRGVSTRRRLARAALQKRFGMAHRTQMVLCDGKHFLAGPTKKRRVALFFIDDATRYIPTVIVGPSESSALFLRGAYHLFRRVGRVDALYMDNGSGFTASDTTQVLASLKIGHILGTAGYPEGKGKVERFNRTVQEHLLRHLSHPDVDPDFKALELRIEHFLREEYHHWRHEGLGGKTTPHECFFHDERALRPFEEEALRAHFFVTEKRKVSNDHVVKLNGEAWEVPLGLARKTVNIQRDVLGRERFFLDHQGRRLKLERVDREANARARRTPSPSLPQETQRHVKGAALSRADNTLAPITSEDGGYTAPDNKETSS